MEIKIGYQGIEGSNSEAVALRFIAKNKFDNVKLVPLINSKNVVKALENGKIDYGVMATKNAIAGIVEETRIALENMNLKLIDEDIIPIRHYLFKRRDVDIENIVCVASHIQALKQTQNNRKRLFSNLKELEIEDTALAAKYLANGEIEKNIAVVCRKEAGLMFDLELIYENLEDDKNNYTEFGIYVIS